jgi:nucleoside-diphosphate-sugar epimerase
VEEVLSRDVADSHSVALVVCRAWSVSGPLVTRPADYAFSDLITQAASGRIVIRAPHEVWRRYVGVDDLLAACITLAGDSWAGEVNSGGPLVELAELAEAIAAEVRPGTEVERPILDGTAPDCYHSDGTVWNDACERLGFVPAPLDEQIRRAAAGLLSGRAG